MPHGIYPIRVADELAQHAGQPWCPSNGTEGEIFISSWCGECARDKSMRDGEPIEECDDDEKCEILGNSFLGIDHPDFPKEWCYGKDGQPCCTAYVPADQELPAPRCEFTQDMFGDPS